MQEGTLDAPRTARDWHWQRQSVNKTGNTSFYTNAEGSDYWVGINLDENGSTVSDPSALSFNPISLSGFEAAKLEIDLASSTGLEKTDYLSIFAISNESNQKILIDSFESGSSIISDDQLSTAFQSFEYDLSVLGLRSFRLGIEAFSNASKESFAIDNINIFADPIYQENDDGSVVSVSAPNHLMFASFFSVLLWFRKNIRAFSQMCLAKELP
jgi:hypothetical protein